MDPKSEAAREAKEEQGTDPDANPKNDNKEDSEASAPGEDAPAEDASVSLSSLPSESTGSSDSSQSPAGSEGNNKVFHVLHQSHVPSSYHAVNKAFGKTKYKSILKVFCCLHFIML